jgi:hypothetical protein
VDPTNVTPDDTKLIYLATPYSKWDEGITMAYVEASKLTAKLLRAGYKVYSPIAHTHPIATYGNVDPYDHAIWLPFDQIMMDKADVLFVAEMEGWKTSKGVQHEITTFLRAGKLVYFVDPETLRIH